MRIAIDATVATKQLGGISEYARSLLVGLSQLSDQPEYYLLRFGRNQAALRELPPLPKNFHDIHVRLPQRLVDASWHLFGAPKINRWLPDCDLFFMPHFLLPAGEFPRLVVAVHDVLFLDHAEWFLPQDVARFTRRLQAAVRRADHIVTASEASKDSLIRHRLAPAHRITAIPLGVDLLPAPDEASRSVRAKYQLPEHYLLYIGTLEPRKNILRQLESYAQLRQAGLDQPFVLAGRRGWLGQELEETIRRFDLGSSVIFTGDFPREDKAGLLSGASVFLFPSLAEGFGIPPLEAMAAGVPVVTSNVSSLPEVVGDAALQVDPRDTAAIASAIQSILDDPKLAAHLRRAGQQRARRFSWRQTAAATADIFKKVAG